MRLPSLCLLLGLSMFLGVEAVTGTEGPPRKSAPAPYDKKAFSSFLNFDLSRPWPSGSLVELGIEARTVHGRLLDHSGAPMTGVQVAIVEPVGYSGECFFENFDTTDGLGRFVVTGHRRKHRLIFRKAEGQVWKLTHSPEETDVVVHWPEPALCEVHVDPQIAGPGTRVRLSTNEYWAGMSSLSLNTKIGNDQIARFENIIPAQYNINVGVKLRVDKRDAEWPIERGQVNIVAGQHHVVHCQPNAGTRLSGKVNTDGKFLVSVRRQKRSYVHVPQLVDHFVCNGLTVFETRPLSPGNYVVTIRQNPRPRQGGTTFKYRVKVTGQEETVDLLSSIPEGVAGEIQRIFDQEYPLNVSWSHADVQISNLARIADKEGLTKELLRLLHDPEAPFEWRHLVCRALAGRTGDVLVVESILDALQNSDLEAHEPPRLVGTLEQATASVEEIIEVIAPYRNSNNFILSGATYRTLSQLSRNNRLFKDQLIPLIITGLKDPIDDTRIEVAITLGQLNATDAVDELLAARHDPSPRVAVWAAYSAWKLTGDPDDLLKTISEQFQTETLAGKSEAVDRVAELVEFTPIPEEIVASLKKWSEYVPDQRPRTPPERLRQSIARSALRALETIAEQERSIGSALMTE